MKFVDFEPEDSPSASRSRWVDECIDALQANPAKWGEMRRYEGKSARANANATKKRLATKYTEGFEFRVTHPAIAGEDPSIVYGRYEPF